MLNQGANVLENTNVFAQDPDRVHGQRNCIMVCSPRNVLARRALHIIQRGNSRQTVFFSVADYRFYHERLNGAADRSRLKEPNADNMPTLQYGVNSAYTPERR